MVWRLSRVEPRSVKLPPARYIVQSRPHRLTGRKRGRLASLEKGPNRWRSDPFPDGRSRKPPPPGPWVCGRSPVMKAASFETEGTHELRAHRHPVARGRASLWLLDDVPLDEPYSAASWSAHHP